MSEFPIGIFDSGIGGLTLAKSITKLMPKEKIIYFGDTLHLPYGEKSKKQIQKLSLKIVDFLIQKNCKAIIIACNSASSSAVNYIINNIPKQKNDVIIFNVIDPVIKFINDFKPNKKIGVIGTNATIKSNIYEKKILELDKKHKIISLATPLLAPMIESNYYNESIKLKIIQHYLSNKLLNNIDYLILGCTHYPLIGKEIQNFFNGKLKIINALNYTSEFVMQSLEQKKILSTKESIDKKHEFFVSDLTESFQESAKLFFGKKIVLKEKNIF